MNTDAAAQRPSRLLITVVIILALLGATLLALSPDDSKNVGLVYGAF